MENKVENINIEKNKELFEYEMTEVILKLKGEFAAFSGKDTRFADMVVANAKLRVNTSGVVQVRMEDRHIETPSIGNVQQTETAHVEVKETSLQLPIIPQISDDHSRNEEKTYNYGKADIWQGIVVPVVPSISKVTIREKLTEKSLKEVEVEIASSVDVPQLASVVESTRELKKKAHVIPVQMHVPKTKLKYSVWNKDNSSIQCEQCKIQKSVPTANMDSHLISERLRRLLKVQIVGETDIKVLHIAPNMTVDVGIENSKNNEAYIIDVSHTVLAEGSVQEVPAITCEPITIKVPSIKPFELHEFKKVSVTTSWKQIKFQETHSFKHEIKKSTVVKGVTTVPELKYIQTYNVDKVNGNLGKVRISHYGTIAIPQKPEVKEIVDNIIALAIAKS